MNPRANQLAAKLELLGLNPSEASAYVTVVQKGLCKVIDIAREARLQRPEVYNIMDRLHSLGLVEETLDRPVRYRATAIQESIDALAAAFLRNEKEILSGSKDLVVQLEKIRRKGEIPSEAQVRIITGLKNIRSNFRDALSSAEKEVWIVAQSPGTRSDVTFMLKEVAARRIRARAVLDVKRYNLHQVRRLASQVDIRHYQPLAAHLFGVDDKLVGVGLQSAAQVEPENMSEVVTNYPSYVQTTKASFESLWDHAVPLEPRVAKLQGHDYRAERVSVVWGRNAIFHVVLDWIQTAKKDVIEVTTKNGPIRLSQRFESKTPNARFPRRKSRILCYMSPNNSDAIRKLSRLSDLRLLGRPFGFGVAVRDNSEVLLHYIYPDSTDLVDSPNDLALVLEEPRIARNMRRMLESMWKGANPYRKKQATRKPRPRGREKFAG